MPSKFGLINTGVGAFLLINLEIVYGMNSTQDNQSSSNQTPTPLRLRNICLDNEEALFKQLDKLFLEQGLFNKIKHELKENGRLFSEAINKLKSISLDDTNKSLVLAQLNGSTAKTVKEIIKYVNDNEDLFQNQSTNEIPDVNVDQLIESSGSHLNELSEAIDFIIDLLDDR